MTLFLLLAVLAHTVLSSAYFNNEYFPYITAKEVVELWNKKVTLDYVSDKSFSCEAVHLGNTNFRAVDYQDIHANFMKDWLNTETAKRPPVLVVVPQEPQTQNFLLDVKYTDFSGIQDIPYDYPRAKCFIVPPFKPLMYTSLFSPSKSLDIYALREQDTEGMKNGNKCPGLDFTMLKDCQVVGTPLSHDKPVHPFFLTASRRVVNRLSRLVDLAKNWDGSLSAAVAITNMSTEIPLVVDAWLNTPEMRRNVDIHLVLDDKYQSVKEMIRLFPINYLRDIAFKNTRSNLVLFVEGDYIVPRDLRKNLLKRVPLFLSEPKTLFVTGLFDAKKGVSLSDIPQNKSELISLWNRKGDKLILPRDRGAFREWNHHRWKGTNDIYEIWTSSYFEPYSVAHRTTQFYDETYVTWGVDKVEQVRSLKKLGYKTKVLPEAFVIHLSHDDLDKDYKGWYDGLNDGPRTQMKLGTSDNRKKALPGLLANNYYPHWLWNISNKANNNTNACKESSKVYTLRNSIDATKTNITMLKQTLYCLVVNLVVLCVIVVRVKKGTSKNRITKVTVVAKEGHTS